eukprot:2362856-Prymnesium_polylepis.1
MVRAMGRGGPFHVDAQLVDVSLGLRQARGGRGLLGREGVLRIVDLCGRVARGAARGVCEGRA